VTGPQEKIEKRRTGFLQGQAQVAQHPRGHTFRFRKQAEQQVLCADVVVIQAVRGGDSFFRAQCLRETPVPIFLWVGAMGSGLGCASAFAHPRDLYA